MDISKEELDKLFEYDPETGVFKSKTARPRSGPAGTAVGWPDKDGYLRVNINYKSYPLHRIAFVMMGEELPINVDHINGVVDDNRWENLRAATLSQNACNRELRQKPKSGYKGVRWVGGKWVAIVKSKGKQHYGGRYLKPEDAFKAACRLREQLFGEFASHY